MSNTQAELSVREIQAALDAGPIPGPWYVKEIKGHCTDEVHTSHPDWQREGTQRSFVTSADHAHGHDAQIFGQCARYIAACNPANMREVLALIQSQAAEIERMRQDKKKSPDWKELLTELTEALDNSFISSWQSTAGWQKQLNEAMDALATTQPKG